MKVRMLSALAIVTLAVAMATACTSDPGPAPTPTPLFSSEEEAFAAAEATYRAYVEALNNINLRDPRSFETVFSWTTGELNSTDRRTFSEWHAEGYAVEGLATIPFVAPVDFSPGEEPLVTLDACYDVTAVDVVDEGGTSMVSPTRPDVQFLRVSLDNSEVSPTSLVISAIDAGTGDSPC